MSKNFKESNECTCMKWSENDNIVAINYGAVITQQKVVMSQPYV